MADIALLDLVITRLEATPPPDGAAALVLAAFHDEAAVDAALLDDQVSTARAASGAARAAAPAAVYVTGIEVEGFRGIGPRATLAIEPGPGLTLVVGRNGSGKSSFSEALEMLLLGTNRRWAGRPKEWVGGWQNLHHRHTRVVARFSADGRRQPLELSRTWAGGAEVGASTFLVDGKPGSLQGLGWDRALTSYPPLLSHHDLEGALDGGPSLLYDALAGILGLGELAGAQERLRSARLRCQHSGSDARKALIPLLALLEHTEDERAAAVRAALAKRQWDLDVVERSVDGTALMDEQSGLRRLRDLAALPVVDREQLNATMTGLRSAHDALLRLQGTDAARASETAVLLQDALDVHTHAGGEVCPVCGTGAVLTYEWRLRTGERVRELREEARAVHAAQADAERAVAAAGRMVAAVPTALREGGGDGVDTAEALAAWERWRDAPVASGAQQLAIHLEAHGPPLIAAVGGVRRAANAELERRERAWQPAARAIRTWLPLGLAARDAEGALRRLTDAETWLRGAHDELRDERFRPIAEAVQEHWTALREDSNVSLGALRLEGATKSPQRRLTLDVKVDGEAASALGVMSQGELNCLALSLFLPRAAMPESPFRFVVIDDPVQAMDPAKVEGLARTLARAATQRQVIVLTHDMRLSDAVRYLDIRANVLEVTRREQSVVDVRPVADPVKRYIDDAFAVAMTRDLPPEAVRVIPGFCRLALEAASSLAVTRRMLREGRRYAEVHDELERPTTLLMWLALALLGDATRAGDVNGYLQRHHELAADAVRECNRGTHSGRFSGDPMTFIRAVEDLTRVITEQAPLRGG